MVKKVMPSWHSVMKEFNDVEPHNDRTAVTPSTGYQVKIQSITGYRSLNAPEVYSSQYEIRLSLYDVVYQQFLGETWKSKTISPTDEAIQRSELNINKVVYFHSPVTDPNVILVVEVVVHRGPKNPLPGDESVTTKRTLGWGILRPFKPELQLKDIADQMAPTVRKMDVYQGTPRALLFMGDHIETNEHIQLITGCQLSYTIQKHKNLQSVMHLMPDNVLFSSYKCLPGMAEAFSKSGTAPDHYLKPKCLPHQTCYLDTLALNFGSMSVDKFESQLCLRINQDRLKKDKAEDDGKTVTITERRLMVGVHNGYCYIQKPQFAQLEPEAIMGARLGSFGRGKRKDTSNVASTESTCLVLRSRVQLDEMVVDPGLAVVMQIEYLFALPYTSQAVVKGSAGSIRSQPLSMSVRWTAWCPFAQQSTDNFITLTLQGGMEKNPDNVLFYTSNILTDQQNAEMGKLRFRFLTSDSPMQSDSSIYITSGSEVPRSPNVSAKPPLPSSSPMIARIPSSIPKPVFHHQESSQEHAMTQSIAGNVYNVEVTHLEMEGDLPPIHAPPILPVAQRTSGMSRASYARMYSAGFPDILDRHGNPPDLIDVRDIVDDIDISRDVSDVLQTNEIIIQFLAFGKPQPGPGESKPPDINSIFCSFQFYRFQPVTTNRMSLTKQSDSVDEKSVKRYSSNLPFVLRKIEAGEHLDKGRPGLEIRYYIDPSNMNPGETSSFLTYLRTHTLHIDIWDGDSLMLIGSLSVPLKHLLRQGRQAVAVNHELDVVYSEHTDTIPTITGDLSSGGDVRPLGMTLTHRGKLHMRLGNVGYASENHSNIGNTLPALHGNQKHLVVADISGCGFVGGSVSTAKTYNGQPVYERPKKCVAKKLTDMNKELCDLLLLNSSTEEKSIEESPKLTDKLSESDRKRKLARMLAIREAERNGDSNDVARIGQRALVNKQERTLKIRDLRTVESYRSRLKPNHITELLTLSITTQHTIRPSLGSAHFVELQLKNPFSSQHTVTIECDSPELRVVTDSREWRFFKSKCNLRTPVEENMFNFDQATSLPQIYLRPKETVYVPFRYQGFEVGQEISPGPSQFFKPTPTVLQQIKAGQNHGTIKAKIVRAYLRTSDGKPISVLQINVEPQPHVVDQTFRFYNPEASFLKKCLRLPPFKNTFTDGTASRFHVECSDPEIICQARSAGPTEPQEIFMKAPCGQSPSVRRFFLALYNDAFISAPIQIWQFYIHALQRVDVNSVLGQTTRLALVLKGTQTARMVRCFSSHPLQMEVSPSESFLLTANNVTELTVGVRPIGSPGIRYMYVNVVDVEYHQLIRSWLVAVSSKQPIVSKEFEIEVPIAGGKGCFKKITYTNPYPIRKKFQLLSSRPDLLSFKETQFELASSETFTIGLRFAAGIHRPGKHNVHVFIDDHENKNEETFLIIVNYF
uniref:nephrocystin-4-like n=1 Tax=Styela clava TaxID=7725 RepID=UPI001939C918|nr:nephrocystin-4-like [Styela clava]